MTEIIRIRSGGQTGVDRAALDVARSCDIPVCGWVPKDGWAEDMTDPPGILGEYPDLKEAPGANPRQRTTWNVGDADATLIIYPSYCTSEGTEHTIEIAASNDKPLFIARGESSTRAIIEWLNSLDKERIELNVGGPRESECPGIYEKARVVLTNVIFWNMTKK